MPLSISHRIEEDVAVLELSGTMFEGPSLRQLENKAKEILNGSHLKALLVDVGAVTRIDTSGISELTKLYTNAHKKNCAMRLVNVQPKVKQVLELMHLDRVLVSSPDLASAKSELKGARRGVAGGQ